MHRSTHAFTLLELAIVLALVSLMTGFGLKVFESSSTTSSGGSCYEKTEQQLKVIDTALKNFAASRSRLPKPSLANLGSNDPAFGTEARGSQTDPTQANYGASTATGVPTGMTNTSGVLIGSLPHGTLGLGIDYSSDCWGNKFTYAVTNVLTSSNTTSGYPANTVVGAITLNSNTIAAPNQMSNEIDYVVISHGQNKFGGTPLSAANATARNCNGTAGSIIDKENCDVASGGNATFFSSTRNTGSGAANYFDDLVVYGKKSNATSAPTANLYCWGTPAEIASNGGASFTPRIAETDKKFVKLARGYSSHCGLTTEGEVHCWGARQYGLHGNGSGSDLSVPTKLNGTGTETYFDIAMNNSFGCVLRTSNNRAYCWGTGYIGNGTLNSNALLTQSSTHEYKKLFAHSDSMCGIKDNGEAWCWGSASNGGLGIGTTPNSANMLSGSTTPAKVVGTQAWHKLTSSLDETYVGSMCGLTTNGEAWCWGRNNTGQLGTGFKNIGTGRGYSDPTTISVTGGGGSGMAVTPVLTGDTITSFTITNPGSNYTSVPSLTVNGTGTDAIISPRMQFKIAGVTITDGGTGYTSAPTVSFSDSGGSGATGTATLGYCVTALTVGGGGGSGYTSTPTIAWSQPGTPPDYNVFRSSGRISSVSIGAYRGSFANIPTASFVGGGGSGATLTVTTTPCVIGVTITNPGSNYSNFARVNFSGGGSGARGSVLFYDGILGSVTMTQNNRDSYVPVAVAGNHHFVDITATTTAVGVTFCGLKANGEVWCWGSNYDCGVGNNPPSCSTQTNDALAPTLISGANLYKSIEGTDTGFCGITTANKAFCWGNGTVLGNNSTADGRIPRATFGNYSFSTLKSAVFVFNNVMCGLATNNDVYCWGDNSMGSLGHNTSSNKDIPVRVGGGLKFGVVSPGSLATCALLQDTLNDCPGQTANWGSCSATIGGSMNGEMLQVGNQVEGFAGKATATCTSGVITLSNQSCAPVNGCPDQVITWGAGCSASTGVQANGAAPSLNNAATGYTGTITATCSGGSYTTSLPVCNQNCPDGTATWGAGNACSGPTGAAVHGAPSSVVTNTNSGQVGSVTISCNNGTYNQSGATCSVAPPSNCPEQPVSWGSCSATAPALNHGTNTSVTDAPAGTHTGTATASCNNGTTTASGTCNQHCTGRSESWGGTCAGTTPDITHGNSVTVNNTAGGFTGSVTMSCTNNTLSQSDASCAAAGGPGCYQTFEVYFAYQSDCLGPHESRFITCGAGFGADQNIYGTPQAPAYCGGLPDEPTWVAQECRACGSCTANGQSSGGNPASCCNGDSDGNGTCGTQGGGSPPGTNLGPCGGSDLVCSNGSWGPITPYSCSCDYSSCASGTGTLDVVRNETGCPGVSATCGNGDTVTAFDCREDTYCVCN